MAKRKQDKVATRHISMPPEVLRLIKRQAQQESRSFSQQVCYILTRYVSEAQKAA